MATQLQLRRDTTANCAAYVGAQGEVAVDTIVYRLYVYDGVTLGGYPLAKYYELPSSTNLLSVGSGGTGAGGASGARSNLGAAASGVNGDITELTGLTALITINSTGTTVTATAPTGTLLLSAAATTNLSVIDCYTSGATPNSQVVLRGARGTVAAPTAVQNGDTLGTLGARGYGATGFATGARGRIAFATAENWTDTAQGTYISFATTATGTTTLTEALRIDPSGNLLVAATKKIADQSGTLFCGSFTVATLPTPGTQGRHAFASNGRMYNGTGTLEGAGAGTGGLVVDNGTAWKIVGTNQTVQA